MFSSTCICSHMSCNLLQLSFSRRITSVLALILINAKLILHFVNKFLLRVSRSSVKPYVLTSATEGYLPKLNIARSICSNDTLDLENRKSSNKRPFEISAPLD